MFDPQMKNAVKVAGIAIVLLALVMASPLLGILAAFVGVPFMVYYAFFAPYAPFPKPWKNPFK